jgi:signal transduction histidine kinase
MKISSPRSLTLPIVLPSVTVPLSIFVLVAWVVVILKNQRLAQQVTDNTWLLVSGIISLLVIIAAIVMLAIFLGREILEGRRQTRFIDSVTHELKSPLASLRLCAQTLSKRTLESRQRDNLHQMMIDDIDRLSFFIDDILEANRISDGPRNQTFEEVGLRSLAETCALRTMLRHRVPEDSIELFIEEDLSLFTEPTSLEMILRNLLDNAVKYSSPPVKVVLTAKQSGESVDISVSDNGIGIPDVHLRQIFNRFYRAPLEEVRDRSGTGIGLYVASQLVRSLGGQLKAASEGKDKGAVFSFSLPNISP